MLDRIPKAVWFAAGLGILIGFSGLVGWSSAQPPHHQTIKSAAHTTENKTSQDIAAEIIAYYTKVLAWFTAVLAFASIGQGVMLLRADKITRRAADAAKESADHIPRVERAYLHGGGAPMGEIGWIENSVAKLFPTFRLDINNHGKTPGELLEFGVGWCKRSEVSALPPVPKYTWYYYRDFIQSNAPRSIKEIKMPSEYPIGEVVIFGRFGYRDIFGKPHSNGFMQHGGDPIDPPHQSYVEPDPKWDVHHVGNKAARKYQTDSKTRNPTRPIYALR
jgi:hypothetical protein